MFLFEKHFVLKPYKTRLITLQPERLCRISSNIIGGCSKSKKQTDNLYFLFEKNYVLKLHKEKFLSCNLKGCAVLRRIPSMVDVKAKIKPKTYVFVRNKFRFKTLQNKVNNLET